LSLNALGDHRFRGAEVYIHEHGPLGEVISRNPGRASIAPRRPETSSPKRIDVNGLEEMDSLFVVHANRVQELVSRREYLILHLKADGFSDIDPISALTVNGSHPYSQETSDFATWSLFDVPLS
jgi:hypothetical protein